MLLLIILGIYLAGVMLTIFGIAALHGRNEDSIGLAFMWPIILAAYVVCKPFFLVRALGYRVYKWREREKYEDLDY